MEVYRYTPLKDDQSIRILTLHPGAAGDVLRVGLELMSIDKRGGGYEALSYVWGSTSKTRRIVCDDGEMLITESFFSALIRLRYPDRLRRLWADQVCIDQDSLEEKAVQIPVMDGVYRNADHVLVWLGDDEKGVAKKACDLIKELAVCFAAEGGRDSSVHECSLNLDHLSMSQYFWAPPRILTELPWFTRAWVVQEIGTEAPATLFWGDSQIEWELLHSVCVGLTDHHHLRKTFQIQTPKIKYMYRRFIEPDRSSRHANRFSFFYELHRARHLMASDPRDKVFAMLGHYSIRNSPNRELRELKADYTKTVEDIYTDVAVRGLQGEEDALLTLASVQHDSLPSGQNQSTVLPNNLPSWVPDWRLYQSHILSEPTSPHNAGGTGCPNVKVDLSTKSIRIEGVLVDSVAISSRSFRPREFHVNGCQWSEAIVNTWHDVCGYSDFNLENKYPAAEHASQGGEVTSESLINDDFKKSAVFAYLQTLSNACLAIAWQDSQPYESVPERQWLAHGAAYLVRAAAAMSCGVSQELRELATAGDAAKWARAANGASGNRVFARTKDGYYVLGPKSMMPGDLICIFQGAKVPFCLRRFGTKYLLVGECYMDGVMDGVIFESAKADRVRKVFEIV